MKNYLIFFFLFSPFVMTAQELPDNDKLWIFMMAGQSNMAGRGKVEAQDTIVNSRIWTIDKEMNWILAKEPLHFYEPKMVGLDCGLSFGKELLQNIPDDISIAIIPCAIGGSSVEQWLYDENHRGVNLLSNFKEKAQFVQKHGIIKGIIWHQGESNASETKIPTFERNLLELFKEFRTLINNEYLPIIIGEIGSFAQPEAKANRWEMINVILANIAKNDENIELIATGDLDHKGDNVHFNSQAQRTIGQRYAKKLQPFLK